MTAFMREMSAEDVAASLSGNHKRALQRAAKGRVPDVIYRAAMDGLEKYGLVTPMRFGTTNWKQYRDITERGREVLTVLAKEGG